MLTRHCYGTASAPKPYFAFLAFLGCICTHSVGRQGGIRIVFKYASDGSVHEVFGQEGQDLMRLAHENDIELEGACEGSLACSTCHVVLEPKYYEMLSEPTDEENDMLDLAFGLSDTYKEAENDERFH